MEALRFLPLARGSPRVRSKEQKKPLVITEVKVVFLLVITELGRGSGSLQGSVLPRQRFLPLCKCSALVPGPLQRERTAAGCFPGAGLLLSPSQ